MFCRTINRYLQILIQLKEKNDKLSIIKNSQIVEFLLMIINHERAF